jgi:hypothetical protein
MKYLSQEFLDETVRISQGFDARPNANARFKSLQAQLRAQSEY